MACENLMAISREDKIEIDEKLTNKQKNKINNIIFFERKINNIISH